VPGDIGIESAVGPVDIVVGSGMSDHRQLDGWDDGELNAPQGAQLTDTRDKDSCSMSFG
jgi:hypothetical protein